MEKELNPVSLTRKLISFHTVNPPGRERPCAEYLGSLLEGAGFQVRLYEFAEARAGIVARLNRGGSKPPICFSAHMDTIPVQEKDWRTPPFDGLVDGGRIYGRGASDMKSGLAAMVSAAVAFARLPAGCADLMLVLSAGEETGCTGAKYLTTLPGVLGTAGALVVGEPTSNYPFVGHTGALWLEARTTGVTAHGSMPELGVNAVYKAADALLKLRNFDFQAPAHPLCGMPTVNVGTIAGGININSVPDHARFGVDIRTTPAQSHEAVYEQLKFRLGSEVELEALVDAPAVSTNPYNDWVRDVFDIMEPLLRERPVARSATYFTDASFLTPALGAPPTIILGPGEPDMAHKTDESCRVSKIEEAMEAYLQIAGRWCRV
jgi:succinyl-diaminopimelate desuccinylase